MNGTTIVRLEARVLSHSYLLLLGFRYNEVYF
jgi:hypothetical protein